MTGPAVAYRVEPAPSPAGRATRVPLYAAGAVFAAAAADVAFDPVHRHLPLCPFHAATGWWCPLCGGLRAVDRLAHGQLTIALHDNVVFVALLPLLAVWWLDWVARARLGRPARLPRHAWVGFVLVGILFTVVRNLPFATVLRPT